MNLTELANKYGSDKGTTVGDPPHKYTYLYDLIFKPYRDKAINFMELGLAAGGPEVGGPIIRQIESLSIRMWLEYFPCAQIFGFDISDFSHMHGPRFTFIRGDADDPESWRQLGDIETKFDIIIDDGSHASVHQQHALWTLFPKLANNGIYVIEDLQWQSPVYEGMKANVPTTAEFLISYFERGQYIDNQLLSEGFMDRIKERIRSFAWFPSFVGSSATPKLFVLST